MCSFLAANWLILNLTYANFFLQPRGPDATNVFEEITLVVGTPTLCHT